MQAEQVPIPALLATGAVHHHLIRTGAQREQQLRVGVQLDTTMLAAGPC